MLYKYLQYLTVFCFSVTLSAQTNSTAEEIEKTIDTAYFSHAQGDYLKSIKFAKQAIAESKLNNYNQGIAWGNFFLAQSFLEVGNYEQTLHYLRKAEKNVHTQKDNYLKYEIHRVRGRSFSNMSLLQEAIKEHKKCLELIPKIDKNNEDKQFLTSLSYENISIVYKNLNQIDSSFQYLKKNKEVLESLEEASIPINLINLYSSLGDYYSLQNNFKISEQYFQKSLDLAEKYDYAN